MPFEEGHQLATGRPPGSPNKLTKTFKDALKDAFDALQGDEDANLIAWGKKNPTQFYFIASKLIPTEINHHLDNKIITVQYQDDDNEFEDAKVIP